MKYLGKETSRMDGIAKVTGRARYAAEWNAPHPAYGFLVLSTVARGEVTRIDTAAAKAAPGVLAIFTHENVPGLMPAPSKKRKDDDKDRDFRALRSPRIIFSAQPIALVVADTFEQARHAATLVRAEYREEKPTTDLRAALGASYDPEKDSPKPRGKGAAALTEAEVRVDAEYFVPMEHHHPMEPHGATAMWQDGQLTIWDKTQNVPQLADRLARFFDLDAAQVQVVSQFAGGAFGSALSVNYYPPLAALAAREVGRPVKLVYTRRQMFTGHGYRPVTWQKVSLGASKDGRLTAIEHRIVGNTSQDDDYADSFVKVARLLYQCPNVETSYRISKLDLPTPAPMRAPGAVTNTFAFECAMDELAYALNIDPLRLRLINYAETDPESGKPYSSKALRECYEQGAAKFGWERRTQAPRSMRDGPLLVGWGVATGLWPAMQQPASVRLTLDRDGIARVQSATTDIGPGTGTVMTMIAAEFLGLPPDRVKYGLGESSMPDAPPQGGSWTTASVGSAVREAALKMRTKLLELARKAPGSAFANATEDNVEWAEGKLLSRGQTTGGLTFAELVRLAGDGDLTIEHTSSPSPEREKHATYAHGAQFVEVKVDPDLGTVKVTRVIEATACGRIMNPRTSHSQEIGGVIWGIGMALQEATEIDHRFGRMLNRSLADYHVPVHADVHEVHTMFVEENDTIVNPLGVKGMGELGLVGIPAAIANAVFHATGRRVRELPITPDKLLGISTAA